MKQNLALVLLHLGQFRGSKLAQRGSKWRSLATADAKMERVLHFSSTYVEVQFASFCFGAKWSSNKGEWSKLVQPSLDTQ